MFFACTLWGVSAGFMPSSRPVPPARKHPAGSFADSLTVFACGRRNLSFVCYFFVVFFAVRFAAGFVSAASAVFLAAAFLGALAGFSAGL